MIIKNPDKPKCDWNVAYFGYEACGSKTVAEVEFANSKTRNLCAKHLRFIKNKYDSKGERVRDVRKRKRSV